jgi:hypothetical protein
MLVSPVGSFEIGNERMTKVTITGYDGHTYNLSSYQTPIIKNLGEGYYLIRINTFSTLNRVGLIISSHEANSSYAINSSMNLPTTFGIFFPNQKYAFIMAHVEHDKQPLYINYFNFNSAIQISSIMKFIQPTIRVKNNTLPYAELLADGVRKTN